VQGFKLGPSQMEFAYNQTHKIANSHLISSIWSWAIYLNEHAFLLSHVSVAYRQHFIIFLYIVLLLGNFMVPLHLVVRTLLMFQIASFGYQSSQT
jgi:hypothetical protein